MRSSGKVMLQGLVQVLQVLVQVLQALVQVLQALQHKISKGENNFFWSIKKIFC